MLNVVVGTQIPFNGVLVAWSADGLNPPGGLLHIRSGIQPKLAQRKRVSECAYCTGVQRDPRQCHQLDWYLTGHTPHVYASFGVPAYAALARELWWALLCSLVGLYFVGIEPICLKFRSICGMRIGVVACVQPHSCALISYRTAVDAPNQATGLVMHCTV